MRIHRSLLSFLLVAVVSEAYSASNPPLATLDRPVERSRYEVTAKKYVISTQGEAATRAAKEMFALGGNAIDAAAAASFVISVERPQSTGLGGGGFMMIRFAKTKEIVAVDFREMAPLKATEKMFQDEKGEVIEGKSTEGPFASAVPGLVAGVLAVHEKYGRLKRAQILRPAIELAETGFRIYPHLATAIAEQKEVLGRYKASKQLFLDSDGNPLKEGDLLVQRDLAKTLRTISEQGREGFYKGWVAEAIVSEMGRLGGLITQEDLDAYDVKFRAPVRGTFHDYEIYSMPPPSSGGIHVVQVLNILERFPLHSYGWGSKKSIHLTSAALQVAFADRAKYLGDTDFISVPIKGLTSKEYAKQVAKTIEPLQARHSMTAGNPLPYESDETTHFSLMDQEGNIVASTQTVNGYLGSGVVVPGTGMLLNNEMDDFSTKVGASNLFGAVGSDANAVTPRKRPLSSMSPTIVLKDGKPVLALGSPSGTRIISCVVDTILNYLEYKRPLYESVAAVRYHHQWSPDEIRVDRPGFSPAMAKELEEMGYKLNVKDLGCKVQAVAREGRILRGVADPRDVGMSLGE